ncbi:MAG: YncE family protein [Myxococcaceae bacterium]
MRPHLLFLVLLGGCASKQPQEPGAVGAALPKAASPAPEVPALPSAARPHPVALLPGGASRGVTMDYLGYEPTTDTVWAPGGNTGRVFVVDAQTERVQSVEGFPTRELNGRTLGPSSVTFGPRSAYVGNRADASVCAVDLSTHQRGACVPLSVPPDGLAYVASSQEVWATLPRSKSIAVLAVSETGLEEKAQVQLDGTPEGYAVDLRRGRFYTNLEDKDETLALDVTTRAVVARWKTGCGAKGPRGLALDADKGLLFVACTDGFVALLLERNGFQLAGLVTGAGVDGPAILPSLKRLFAASGGTGMLSFVGYTDAGRLSLLRRVATAPGVRVVVADQRGKAFAADSSGGCLWVAGP